MHHLVSVFDHVADRTERFLKGLAMIECRTMLTERDHSEVRRTLDAAGIRFELTVHEANERRLP